MFELEHSAAISPIYFVYVCVCVCLQFVAFWCSYRIANIWMMIIGDKSTKFSICLVPSANTNDDSNIRQICPNSFKSSFNNFGDLSAFLVRIDKIIYKLHQFTICIHNTHIRVLLLLETYCDYCLGVPYVKCYTPRAKNLWYNSWGLALFLVG